MDRFVHAPFYSFYSRRTGVWRFFSTQCSIFLFILFLGTHLHFQLALNPPTTHDMPGVVSIRDRSEALLEYIGKIFDHSLSFMMRPIVADGHINDRSSIRLGRAILTSADIKVVNCFAENEMMLFA